MCDESQPTATLLPGFLWCRLPACKYKTSGQDACTTMELKRQVSSGRNRRVRMPHVFVGLSASPEERVPSSTKQVNVNWIAFSSCEISTQVPKQQPNIRTLT
jgi:hypothetical protein